MSIERKGIAVLGSTGSIGTQTLEIVQSFPEAFAVVGLAANRSLDQLRAQVKQFRPKLVSCNGNQKEKADVAVGDCRDATIDEIVRSDDVDVVVTATAGDVALEPTFAAISAGKDVAIANKETVIMSGSLLTEHVTANGVTLLPLDSEPSAIWQCLRGEDKNVSRLIITASGGAFRETTLHRLADVTPDQALAHPTWRMGRKITIDCATMMNKAFEVIEARWLFNVPWENIEVVIHPQSIIHSMVVFEDGSVKAQLSSPDMRLPIQYALFYPERTANTEIMPFDPVKTGSLTFQALEQERYPCFDMALGLAKRGGTWPAALCGADEAAVEQFLAGNISFLEIESIIAEAVKNLKSISEPNLKDMKAAARWAKERVNTLSE